VNADHIPFRRRQVPWLLSILFAATASPLAWGQGISDLLGGGSSSTPGQSGSTPDVQLKYGLDRSDLGLGPSFGALASPEKKYVGFSAQADLRMICGQYDLKASLQHLLGREAREEFLEGILQSLIKEVVGSGMDLLCQAEPTLCTLLQNYQVTANMKVGYYHNLCQAIESAVVDSARKNYANTVDQCLKDKKDQGVPIDQAIEACQKKPTPITGFHGEVLASFDLGKELDSVFSSMGLSPGASKLAQRVSDQTKLAPGTLGAQIDPNSLTSYFDEKRQSYADKLGSLIDQAAQRMPVATVDLRFAVPAGAPPLAEDEVRQMALLSPEDQAAAVASISTALALFEMGNEIHEVERALEVLKTAPGVDEAKRNELEARRMRLRTEKVRLVERTKDQSVVMEAYAAARGMASREYSKRVATIQTQAGDAERKKDLVDELAAPGALPAPKTSKRGLVGYQASASTTCTSCGLEGSFGSYGADK
jgi:hypothetical protein